MYNLTLFTVEQTSGQINRILSKIKTPLCDNGLTRQREEMDMLCSLY